MEVGVRPEGMVQQVKLKDNFLASLKCDHYSPSFSHIFREAKQTVAVVLPATSSFTGL